MKKCILICLIVAMHCIPLQSQAQLLGKWVIPIGTDNSPAEVLVLEFMENDLLQYSTIALPTGLISSADQIGDGAFSSNYELDYYIVSDYLFYGAENTQWNAGALGGFVSEFEIIPRPQNPGDYFMIYCERTADKNLESHLRLNHVWFEDGEYQIGADQSIAGDIHEGTMAAFAITDETAGERKIYTASQSFWSEWGDHQASLRSYIITDDGIDWNTFDEIIVSEDSPFEPDDFISYNLEMKTEGNGDISIAWITQHALSNSKIFIVIDEDEESYDLGFGRIGGIEFSSLEPNILYVSCHNEGIIKMDYNTGTIHSTLSGSGNFGHTFLQTAPDGHIYAVSDDGTKLGRINQSSGLFEHEAFSIPNYPVATYREFDNNRYYILPENHRIYDPLIVSVITIDESCPGYADGEASICVSGGTPGIPPDEPEYTITCIGPGGNDVFPDSYDPVTNCFHFTELSAGTYSYEILDAIDTYYEGSFEIEPYNYDEGLVDISSSMSWDEHYDLHSKIEFGIVVRSNAVLTIDNALLEFGPQAKIVIEPGATIDADNSVFTNLDCIPLQKWKGIEVWGDINDNQYAYLGHPLAQGLIKLNDCTVEHAENAVALWAEEDKIWESSGGIVIAINSYFTNNTRSVHFVPYQNTFPPTGQPCGNLSSFKLCNFTLDINYIDKTMFYKHVDLHGVNGIRFSGCDFLNTATSGVALWNNGIASYGSGFKVDEGCMPPCFSTEPSTFNGFYWAISVLGTAAPYVDYPFEVRNSEFTNNVIGIFASECEWPVIVDNTFVVNHTLVTDGICDFNFGIGIDMYSSYGFAIEDNLFNNNSQAGNSQYSGIRVDNCPSDHDIIYRNIFTDLSYGNYAEGTNRLDPGDDQKGVEYQCNLNNNNVVDFIVTDEEDPQVKAMIRAHHGSSINASGNTFSDIIHNDIWHFRNEGRRDIDWYYCDPCPDEEPITIFTLPPGYFDKHISTNVNSCPDHYGGGGGINITLNNTQKLTKQQEYAQNLADYNSVKALFESLVDGGNTDAEIMDIELAQPDDMWALRSQLLGHSPHLSQEVLREMADRTDVFPDDVIFDILAANPDELKIDTLLLYLEQKEDPLPDYMISILYQLTNNVSYKTVLKRDMAQYYAIKSQAAQDILRSLAHDSLFDALEYRNWLDNFGGIEADKQIVAGYFAENDISSATTLLNMLPDIYELEDSRLDVFNDYKDLVLMQYAWQQQGRSIFELDSSELAELSNYAYNSEGTAKAVSRNILTYLQLDNFCNCMHLNDSSELKVYCPTDWSMFDQAFGPKISVQPNPANIWVAFNYELSDHGLLRISNAEGRLVHEVELHDKQGQYVWDTRGVQAGVYIYTISSNDMSKSGKLIIR